MRGCIDGDVLLSSLQASAEGMDFDLAWDLCDVSVEVGVVDEAEGAEEEEEDDLAGKRKGKDQCIIKR